MNYLKCHYEIFKFRCVILQRDKRSGMISAYISACLLDCFLLPMEGERFWWNCVHEALPVTLDQNASPGDNTCHGCEEELSSPLHRALFSCSEHSSLWISRYGMVIQDTSILIRDCGRSKASLRSFATCKCAEEETGIGSSLDWEKMWASLWELQD